MAAVARRSWLLALALSQSPQPATAQGDHAPDRPTRTRIGLVLSGGGARGIAHVGVLQVLEQLRIPVDCVAGTSMGAIVGGLYAYGLSPEQLERAMLRSGDRRGWDQLLQDHPDRRDLPFRRRQDDTDFLIDFDLGFRDGQLILPRGLAQAQNLDLELRCLAIEAHDLRSFDDLPLPFRAVATDIRTGSSVELAAGNLPAALRASMSVPGAFAPVRIGDQEFLDGGLVQNLPIDAARRMGADVLIVVDIGSPLLRADQITSLVGVTEQVVAILTQQNVDRALDRLADDDVLLQPDLEDLTAGDFAQPARAIALGRRAAMAAAARLQHLALAPDDYAAWRARQRRAPRPLPVVDEIALDNGSRLDDAYLRSRMRTPTGSPLDLELLRRDIEQLYGLDEFAHVTFTLHRRADGDRAALRIRAEPKDWGPNYVEFGLQVRDEFDGDADYQFAVQYTMRELNAFGGEWRTQLGFGSRQSLATELYQPVEPTGTLFVASRALAEQFPLQVFADGRQVASLEATRLEVGLDAGTRLQDWGELRFGVERQYAHGDVRITSTGLDDVTVDDGRLFAHLRIDALDAPLFARSGGFCRAEWSLGRTGLGADQDYQTVVAAAGKAVGGARWGAILLGRYDDALEGGFPLSQRPALGGLFQLSGMELGQLSGDHAALAMLATYWRLGEASATALGPASWLGATVEWGNADDRRARLFADARFAGSLALGFDTLLGPILAGYGRAEGGHDSAYLVVGFTF